MGPEEGGGGAASWGAEFLFEVWKVLEIPGGGSSGTELRPLTGPQQSTHLVCVSLQLMIVIKGEQADRHPLLPDCEHAAATRLSLPR